MVTPPMVFSFIAICISCVALWKGHFARFSPLAIAGNLQHRIYPFRSGDERWHITSFDIPVSVTNPAARPGLVTGLRLRLHYPELPFADNYEFIFPKWELKPDKLNLIGMNRLDWIDEVVACDWSPFVVLPKGTISKHLLFETRWDTPVIQRRIVATLEMQVDGHDKWPEVNKWTFAIRPRTWVDLESGRAIIITPDNSPNSHDPECSPRDLHKFTGTKAALPTEGALGSMEPSHLDYPSSDEN